LRIDCKLFAGKQIVRKGAGFALQKWHGLNELYDGAGL
jgi:hypothetical protein